MADNSNLDRIEIWRNNTTGLYWYVNGNGEWTEFSTSGGVTGNLYTEDGTLQGNRVVTGNSKNLTVTGVGTLTYVGTLVYVTGGSGGLELKTENGGTLLVSSNADLNVTAAAASAINITKAGAGDVNISQTGTGQVNIESNYASGKYTKIDGVKVYKALLNQSGTNAPVATVLQNSLGAVPTYGYTTTGLFTFTATGLLTLNKTVIYFGSNISTDDVDAAFIQSNSLDEDGFVFSTLDNSTFAWNGVLREIMITVEVYP